MAKTPLEVSSTETAQVVLGNGTANGHLSSPAQTNDNTHRKANNEVEAKTFSESSVADGGWGWVVVFGSFTIHVIIYGISYSFGVFVEDFVNYFECSKREVGALGSLVIGVIWIAGTCQLAYYIYYSELKST